MAQATTDHERIRRWAEAKGGKPAAVDSTHQGGDGAAEAWMEEAQYPNAMGGPECAQDRDTVDHLHGRLAIVARDQRHVVVEGRESAREPHHLRLRASSKGG